MKDLFSQQANSYAQFRPHYPQALLSYLASLVKERKQAWDCGTGNGQAAIELAEFFDHVIATDPSEKQLIYSSLHPKVEYQKASAEKSGLPDQSVDLITVAQAFHWFDSEKFFQEAKRVLKPQGILALWCYSLASFTPEIDAILLEFYQKTLSGYWEKERQLVDEGYQSAILPFEELNPPSFEMKANWPLEHLIGYLKTWSAVQTYLKRNHKNPLENILKELTLAWGSAKEREVRWNLFLRVGRVAQK